MKLVLTLVAFILACGYIYAQKEKEKRFEMPYNPEVPHYRGDTLFMQHKPAPAFRDNMIIIVPDRSEMAKMPMMPIDSTTEFTILRKELYRSEDQYYKNKEPRHKFED